MQTVPTPQPLPAQGFHPQNFPQNTLPKGDLGAAKEARRLQIEGWSSLNLRQTFADETFMRDQIRSAGLRAPNQMEPATAPRLRSFLKRAGIAGPEFIAAVGTNVRGYLALNPLLPLWAAVALVLEATGRFTRETFDTNKKTSA